MLAIRLPAEIENRLEALARATGRTKTFYVREAILEHLDDLEAAYLNEPRLSDTKSEKRRPVPAAVKKHRLDPETEAAVRRFLASIADRYEIAGAIVYGSRARGTHRPDSDADVAVLLKGEHRPTMETVMAMADVAFDVLLETEINVSPLPIWLDEWEHPETHPNPFLLANIAREGVRL